MKLKSQISLKNLNQLLKSKIFGQNHAIDKITDMLNINYAGLGDDNKPIGSFLFTGPTGVGKTELSIQLSKALNIDFKRFDMSEYSEKHSIKNFIGGDAGLVGHEEGGLLINYMLDNPKSVILFDEIEKAHKDVMNIFLQVLDYGHLTSTKGIIVSFNNTILIFTSNLGVQDYQLRRTMGFISDYVVENNLEEEDNQINTFFKPEFRGRMDCIIPFNSLNKEMISSIIDKNVSELITKLKHYNLEINLSFELKDFIINNLLKENLGARSIAKIFRDNIKTQIATEIIYENIKFGSELSFTIDNNDNFILNINNSIKDNSSFLDSETIYFENVIEAQNYAKANPSIKITRSPSGIGFITKKISII